MKYFVGLLLSIVIFTSCGQKKKTTYRIYSSVDNTYSVEVPSDATQGRCILDLMSFENTNSHITITIQHINEGSIEEYIRNKHTTDNTFSYNLFHSSHSIKSQEGTTCGRLMTFICSNVWMERTIFSM